MVKLLVGGMLISCFLSCKVPAVSSSSQTADQKKVNELSNISKVDSSAKYVPGGYTKKETSENLEVTNNLPYSNSMEDSDVSSAKPTSAVSSTPEYRVQLAVTNNLNNYYTFPFSNVTTRVDNNKMIYEIAGYTNANEAYNYAQTLRKKKVAGAFVTKYVNSVRDYSYNYLMENTSKPASTPTMTKSSTSTEYTITPSADGKSKVVEIIDNSKPPESRSSKILIVE